MVFVVVVVVEVVAMATMVLAFVVAPWVVSEVMQVGVPVLAEMAAPGVTAGFVVVALEKVVGRGVVMQVVGVRVEVATVVVAKVRQNVLTQWCRMSPP